MTKEEKRVVRAAMLYTRPNRAMVRVGYPLTEYYRSLIRACAALTKKARHAKR